MCGINNRLDQAEERTNVLKLELKEYPDGMKSQK